jgi:drug/metabolite transporter (DMT)-like permease
MNDAVADQFLLTWGRRTGISRQMTILVYILLCLIWGSTWLAVKVGLADAPPFLTASARFLIAIGVLWTICRMRGYELPRDRVYQMKLAYPGLYMYGLSYALVYLGMQHVNSAVSAVLFASFPFFVAAFAWLKYRSERLGLPAWGGMTVGFAGVVLISYDSFQTSGDLFLGTALVVAASAASAYGIVIHKQRFSHENVFVASLVQMTVGLAVLLVGALALESLDDFHVTTELVGSILYLGTMGTVVTFSLYYWLLKKARVTVVSLVAFITPLVAILIGVIAAHEILTPLIVTGAVMILSGVFLVVRK